MDDRKTEEEFSGMLFCLYLLSSVFLSMSFFLHLSAPSARFILSAIHMPRQKIGLHPRGNMSQLKDT